tara:strand:- start:7854 stop:9494 length:1641 start_codon:yes stop_codon:yes gene_type:complete
MATGFGYVRDAKPMQINWQDVGKQMSDNIQSEVKDRQKRKDDINKQLADYNKELLNQPQGTNAEVNRFMGDFTSDAGDAMRNAERLLKSGQMSERDFYKFRANANQGTDLMFEAGKKFNEGYDESMRRFGAGESQAKENWMRQQTEGFLNFAKNGAYINPLTGEVNVARRYKDQNGDWQISTTPGDFANASELVQQATRQYDSFDLDGAVTNAVKGLGATLIQESDGRTTKEFFLASQKGELGVAEQALLAKAKKDMVASFTVNPDNVSSILTGNIGMAPNGTSYDFTYDEEEAKKNPHLILVNPDGTNNFDTPNGKKQLEAAQKYAEARFEASLGGTRKEAKEDKLSKFQKEQLALQKRRLDQNETDEVEDDLPYISNVNVIATEEGSDLAKTTIRGLNEDSLNEENFDKTAEVITNVFDNQKFPSGATLNRVVGGEIYEPEQSRQTISGKSTLTIPAKTKVDALELFVPDIMTESIRIPAGEEFSKSLDKIINLLDTRKNSDKPVGKEEFIKFFENQEVFERYNPIEQKDQTNVDTDATKKKFG